MWMVCLTRREKPFEILGLQRARYRFARHPRDDDEAPQIGFVADPADQQQFLSTNHFVKYTGPVPDGVPAAAAAQAPIEDEPKAEVTTQTAGVNIYALEGDALREYAKAIGIGRVGPNLKDDTLRARIIEHLEQEHQNDLDELQGAK